MVLHDQTVEVEGSTTLTAWAIVRRVRKRDWVSFAQSFNTVPPSMLGPICSSARRSVGIEG